MATLARGGRIDVSAVDEELDRLRAAWSGRSPTAAVGPLLEGLSEKLDRFDQVQLAEVIRVVRSRPTLSAAGRVLFDKSRLEQGSVNDADRLWNYLAKLGLSFDGLTGAAPS